MGNVIRELKVRMALLLVDDTGMSTVEYAIGTLFICPWRLGSCAGRRV
jgi:hypothetical protein